MKVLVAGTFCSGKTTLASELHAHLANSLLVSDICREMLDTFPLVNWRTPEIRDYLIVRQLLVERKVDQEESVIIIDSGIIGNLAHDRALLDASTDRGELVRHLGHHRYDIVFHCDYREIILIDDGQRFMDAKLRDRVDQEIINVLAVQGYHDYVSLSGNKKRRLLRASQLILELCPK